MYYFMMFIGFASGWSLIAGAYAINRHTISAKNSITLTVVKLLYIPLCFILFIVAPALYLNSNYFKNVYLLAFILGVIAKIIMIFSYYYKHRE